MHLPFAPATYEAAEQHAALPELVPIEELSARALDAAAQEIAEHPGLEEEAEQ